MENLFKKIDQVIAKTPEARHSYFQLKYFVLGKEPTTQSKMWQCLRELKSRKENIDTTNLEIEEIQDQLELLTINKENIKPESKEDQIKLRMLNRKQLILTKNLQNLEEKVKFLTQEAKFFLQAFENLEQVEPLKDYDNLEVQKEYWNEKLLQEINLKMLLSQPLDVEITKTILALPKDLPVRIQVEKALEHVKDQFGKIKESYFKRINNEKNLQS